MKRLYRITHVTRYRYDAPVVISRQLAHLRPRDGSAQRCLRHRLAIAPQPQERIERLDYFGNPVTQFSIEQPHDSLEVVAESIVRVEGRPRWPECTMAWEEAAARMAFPGDAADLEAAEYAHPSPSVPRDPAARDYASAVFSPKQPMAAAVEMLMRRMHDDFAFDPEATSVTTPVADVLERRRGVCQDFAHVMLACVRAMGLAARYVSGYLLTSPPPGRPRLIGADASHAWVSVFCPGSGWMDFDPTNALIPSLEHVTLGWGRDFSDVGPLRGVILGGGSQTLEVEVTMLPEAADALSEEAEPAPKIAGAADF